MAWKWRSIFEESSIVLLRNEHSQLPLSANVKQIAIIGSHADVGVLSGGGSAQVDPVGGNAVQQDSKPGDISAMMQEQVWHRSSPLKAIQALAPNAEVVFEPGGNIEGAAAKAKISDVAIVFVSQHTHEGNDLNTLALPGNQNALVEAVAAANPHTIVIIESGAAITMPWANKVSAIVEAWYPGIRGGEAIANILFGKVNPSGKLSVTFPMSDADLPRPKLPAPPDGLPGPMDGIMNKKQPFDIRYDEGLKVGYRWYESEGKKPLYAFGHGLAYTHFGFSGLQASGGGNLSITLKVQNAGKLRGQETAQVYVKFPNSADEPAKRLVGWEKVDIAAGDSSTVTLQVDPLYLSVYNDQTDKWEIAAGEYEVYAGSASDTLPLHTKVVLSGAK